MLTMMKRTWRPRRATVLGFPPAKVTGRRYDQARGAWGLTLHWRATEPDEMRALRDSIYAPLMLDLEAEEPALYPVLASTVQGHATVQRVRDTLEPTKA